ncbi:F-box protein CPR1-like [Corylus avellana]|uniref:F-box protein CPR1-like n=1 Tax=Corylus avellana TaxID=13451 RepID=UPI00286BB558|nr:F-box protein CPR1-like [Corylus avellana]
MSILPPDLITEILFLLPVKSLVRFQCVSKPWLALIEDPDFIKKQIDTNKERSFIVETCMCWGYAHPKDYYLVKVSNENVFGEPEKMLIPRFNPSEKLRCIRISILGSCNGLVCIRNDIFEIVICNPSIQKHKKIPFEPVDDNNNKLVLDLNDGFSFGFGYDAVNNDFKVLRIVGFWESSEMFRTPPTDVEVKIFSLKANSWRRVEDQWPYKELLIVSYHWAFINGAFHWLAQSATGAYTLLAFDLTTEKFRVQMLPFDILSIADFDVLGGSLCVALHGEAGDCEVWTMKEYGVESSWSRLWKLPEAPWQIGLLLVLSKDNKKALTKDELMRILWYDIQKKTYEIVENDHLDILKNIWTMPYVESLFLQDGDSDN